MRFSSRSRVSRIFSVIALASAVLGLMVTGALSSAMPAQAATTSALNTHMSLSCATRSGLCTEVQDSEQVFGQNVYVGHDEPQTLFYSNQPGAGNRMLYRLQLPRDPAATPLTTGKSFNFQLHPAFWFGMAMCDTQSFPEQISTCTPDSDSNIVDPAVSPNHPGVAFMEMQFYPPGWVSWPAGTSCDARKWCAALNIDSLSQNSVTGQLNNSACLNVAGVEPVNFAFITHNGVSQAPANPVESTLATFTPDPNQDLFMNSGDHLIVALQDTKHGLRIDIIDQNTGQHGFMTASASNGFGQVKFDPAGTTCQNIPSDFHPMYSTSSEQTRVTWAAHSQNIAFSDETGHFDFCNGPNTITPGGACPTGNTEGPANSPRPTDGDDVGCFPASSSTLVQVSGCQGTNSGFDGSAYINDWPDGSPLHPTAIRFTSPLTGTFFNTNYNRVGFEADLPRIESTCNRSTGAGCTLLPITEAGTPAPFYPYYSTKGSGDDCTWGLGGQIPGSNNDFGKNNQYGPLLSLAYTAVGGGVVHRFNDFRQVLDHNPCRTSLFG
ncbi:MAG TPA: hypothetical protein VFU49_20745 [Ktedonobacteraceae bacterium]|nr:hypothetical protein [Ktedonobacteraceae bacterium]